MSEKRRLDLGAYLREQIAWARKKQAAEKDLVGRAYYRGVEAALMTLNREIEHVSP